MKSMFVPKRSVTVGYSSLLLLVTPPPSQNSTPLFVEGHETGVYSLERHKKHEQEDSLIPHRFVNLNIILGMLQDVILSDDV